MAGEAKTSAFMLGNATVMLGPQSALWDLTADLHSIGLVKNFTISTEPTFQELTQGEKSNIVYSVLTANPVRAAMEVYEYTSKNLAYGLGLDGAGIVAYGTEYPLKAAITGSVGSPVTTATFDAAASVVAEFPLGTWITFQHPTLNDVVHIAQLSANTTSSGAGPYTHTLTFANFGFKTVGNNMPINARIQKANRIDVGSTVDQPFFSAKVVGILPERNEPVIILMPKVRITKGFSLAFSMQNFGNLPFALQPYELVSTDPNYALFQGKGPVALMTST